VLWVSCGHGASAVLSCTVGQVPLQCRAVFPNVVKYHSSVVVYCEAPVYSSVEGISPGISSVVCYQRKCGQVSVVCSGISRVVLAVGLGINCLVL
jgi:hypothetical protein